MAGRRPPQRLHRCQRAQRPRRDDLTHGGFRSATLGWLSALVVAVGLFGCGGGGDDNSKRPAQEARFAVGTRFETFVDRSRPTNATADSEARAAADVRDARDLPGCRLARPTPILRRPGVARRPVPARRVLPRQRGLDAGSLRTALQRLGRRRVRDRSTQLSAVQHLTAGSERRCREPARRHQLPHLGDDPVGCRPDEPVRRRGRRRADCRRRPLSVRRRPWVSVSTGAASTGGSTPGS